MNKTTFKNKKAFTLAETLIALVILGIIAAVTIPTLIRNHVDNANRAKVKKAMAMYEKALNNMIIENDLRSTDAIRTFGTTDAQGNESTTCPQTNPYFKTVEGANCRFKTADGVWWDISDITNPILILDSNLRDETTANLRDIADNDVSENKTVFAMIGRYEEDKGILRINDKAYEDGQDDNETNIAYMDKLWAFVNNETSGGNAGGGEGGEQGGDDVPAQRTIAQQLAECETSTCQVITSYNCEKTDENPEGACYINMNKKHIDPLQAISLTQTSTGDELCLWEKNEQGVYVETCNVESHVSAEDIWLSDLIELSSMDDIRSADFCSDSRNSEECERSGDHWLWAKKKCEELGMRLPTLAELTAIYNTDSNQLYGEIWVNETSALSDHDIANFCTWEEGSHSSDFFNERDVFCVGN